MKLRMLSGLPASGKTTLARKMVKESGSAGRVNRDDLRAMLFDSVWSGPREKVIVECEKAISKVLLENNLLAIIDDTNLTPRHRDIWSNFARDNGAKFETQQVDTDILTCIARDVLREKSVGQAVITKLAAVGGKLTWRGSGEIVICDIDGTLADGEHRQHHLRGEKKDWSKYFSLLHQDSTIDFVCDWVRAEFPERNIVLVSGRPDTYQRETVEWLNRHKIPFDYILMRSGNNKDTDVNVKREILKLLPREKIVVVIDDRPVVVRMWREEGLRVVPVRGQCEEF